MDDLESTYLQIEAALLLSPNLSRIPGFQGDPTIAWNRLGVRIQISVKVKGRAKAQVASAMGDTLAEAVEAFVGSIPIWSEVLKAK